jgi:hypothetical protein
MGGMKRLMEQEEEQRRVATRIALEAGVLKSCEVHHEIYDPMGGNFENAYKLGNYKSVTVRSRYSILAEK